MRDIDPLVAFVCRKQTTLPPGNGIIHHRSKTPGIFGTAIVVDLVQFLHRQVIGIFIHLILERIFLAAFYGRISQIEQCVQLHNIRIIAVDIFRILHKEQLQSLGMDLRQVQISLIVVPAVFRHIIHFVVMSKLVDQCLHILDRTVRTIIDKRSIVAANGDRITARRFYITDGKIIEMMIFHIIQGHQKIRGNLRQIFPKCIQAVLFRHLLIKHIHQLVIICSIKLHHQGILQRNDLILYLLTVFIQFRCGIITPITFIISIFRKIIITVAACDLGTYIDQFQI